MDYSFWKSKDGFKISRKGALVLTFNIDSAVRKLVDKYGTELYNANPTEFTFNFKNKTGSFKVVFTQLDFTLNKDKLNISTAAIYLFSTMK